MFTARKENGKKLSYSILFKLTLRSEVFLFFSLLVLLCFYLAGNYLEYLDESLLFILNVAGITGTALIFLGTAGFVESLTFFIIHREKRMNYFSSIIFSLAVILFAFVVLVLFSSIDILSEGF